MENKNNSAIHPAVIEAANELSSGLIGNRCNGYQYSEEFLELVSQAAEAQACLERLNDGLGGYQSIMYELSPEAATLMNKLLRRLLADASLATQASYAGMVRDQCPSVRAAARRAHKDLEDQVRIAKLDPYLK